MPVQLPPPFVERMKQLLGGEFDSFINSYHQSPRAGLRVNTLKISNEEFHRRSPFALRPIPWCETGYYVEAGERPGKHPYYYAGLYYIQEPSAMSPVEALEVQPGDRVLDLCAAPGGKSTQIAAALQGKGLLVTNDLSTERTKALAKNMELYGVRNAVILNESPERIAERFGGFFDKILVDAPCSGEGMFRKDEDAARQWINHSVEQCSIMQRDILQTVAKMLAPGGRIVYSTCTFAPEENERSIAVFLDQHADFKVTLPKSAEHFSRGHHDWAAQVEQEIMNGESVLTAIPSQSYTPISEEALQQTENTVRLWPHKLEGEGHYIAVLDHTGERTVDYVPAAPQPAVSKYQERPRRDNGSERKGKIRKEGKSYPSYSGEQEYGKMSDRSKGKHRTAKSSRLEAADSAPQDGITLWQQFNSQMLNVPCEQMQDRQIIIYGSNLYLSPVDEARLQGLKVIRPGWYLGSHKNGRFTPGHALAAALSPQEVKRSLYLDSNTTEAVSYLKGETLSVAQERVHCEEGMEARGYVLVCIDGYSAGWGKWQQDGILKNEYPAGWRWI